MHRYGVCRWRRYHGNIELIQSKIVKHKDDGTIFEEKDIWKWAFDMLKGLKTLHDSKILHRDIKSANIFLCDGVAKIGDLNISKLLQS